MFGAYLDCNATAPLEPAVKDTLIRYFADEVGNSGSRTHEYGIRANRAVEEARERVASVVKVKPDEVVFTSGATESDNIALLGIADYGRKTGRNHIVSSEIEHKAVLEPLDMLERQGFEITLVKPNRGGRIEVEAIEAEVRTDTLLVSVMHVNNETGVLQPINEIAEMLGNYDAYFHTDAAQGFGKSISELCNDRIDLISVSSHKIYGPVGVGALVIRKRGFKRPPVNPLVFGGGQERGLRPGTIPVALVAGFGLAAEIAEYTWFERRSRCIEIRESALEALGGLGIYLHGDQDHVLPHVVNFSVPKVESEAVMLSLKGLAAVSNGSACTSQSYTPSHVLKAMELSDDEINGAVRLSWCHLTDDIDWSQIASRIGSLM
ncbi:MAG: cysteine desulfurase DndA [Gemmatimonadetes bacterium]|nr:cysteine desulfurase DndA [Gemmatimonadota bacterium]MYB62286.1 cysteine desulfurase DndA [Gemmatimonadota bacterium]